MIIYSKPGAATFYKAHLPDILADYWIPGQKIMEAETIATSTAKAGFFRQVTKYDVTSIKRQYSAIVDNVTASYLLAMAQSLTQDSWYVSNGSSIYECHLVIDLVPLGRNQTAATINLSVIAQVS